MTLLGLDKYLLPPVTKLRQGNVFTPVCQSFCSRGGMHARGHVWWGHALQGACVPRGTCVAGGLCVARETATAAGGTHPTGMHSC